MEETITKIDNREGGFLNFFEPLIPVSLPLIKNALTPLAKSILLPLGLTEAASATNADIN